MISAAQETFQPAGQEAANPFAGLFPSTTQSQPAQTRPVNTGVGSETTNPLPNPWAPPTSTTSQPPTSTATSAAGLLEYGPVFYLRMTSIVLVVIYISC